MGRRTKLLNVATRNTVLEYISKGNYIKTACMAAGIDDTTYCMWIRKAEEYERNPDGDGYKIYHEFLKDLKKAEAKAEAERTKCIDEAGSKPQFWMAKAWINERKDPERWGRREVLEIGPSKVLVALQEQAQRLTTPKLIEISDGVVS